MPFRVPPPIPKKEHHPNGEKAAERSALHPHPHRMHLQGRGLSHGLKTCPWHVFLTPFRISQPIQKRTPPQWVVFFFGARDGTRTHTAKPHAPQTCLSTIPTLSQALKYYNRLPLFCQYLFKNPLKVGRTFGKLYPSTIWRNAS